MVGEPLRAGTVMVAEGEMASCSTVKVMRAIGHCVATMVAFVRIAGWGHSQKAVRRRVR